MVFIHGRSSISVVATGRDEDSGKRFLVGAEHIVFDSSIGLFRFIKSIKAQAENPKLYLRTRIGDVWDKPRSTAGYNSPGILLPFFLYSHHSLMSYI